MKLNTQTVLQHPSMRYVVYGLLALIACVALNTSLVSAQDNPTEPGYKLAVCDGPALPSGVEADPDYVVCNFQTLIGLVQHLITAMITVGVFVAIAGFMWMGYLFISGTQENRKKAYSIFPKIFWGFIIMLSAWFIVYQLLSWLGSNEGFKTLLNN